jgi:hypothetical protein
MLVLRAEFQATRNANAQDINELDERAAEMYRKTASVKSLRKMYLLLSDRLLINGHSVIPALLQLLVARTRCRVDPTTCLNLLRFGTRNSAIK